MSFTPARLLAEALAAHHAGRGDESRADLWRTAATVPLFRWNIALSGVRLSPTPEFPVAEAQQVAADAGVRFGFRDDARGRVRTVVFTGELLAVPRAVVDALGDAKAGKVELRFLGASGGDTGSAAAILAELEKLPARTVVESYIEDRAPSAHSLLACLHRGRRFIRRGATIMVHRSVGVVAGTPVRMRQRAAELDQIENQILAAFAARTGQPLEVVQAWHRDGTDTTFDAQAAVDVGLADELVD